jgi:hypothetical protein
MFEPYAATWRDRYRQRYKVVRSPKAGFEVRDYFTNHLLLDNEGHGYTTRPLAHRAAQAFVTQQARDAKAGRQPTP